MPSVFQSERDVETKLIHPLFHDILAYPEENLNWAKPVTITFGHEKKTKQADLVVYHDNKPLIVVEAKKPTESVNDNLPQLDSYAFALETPYSVITNGNNFILRGYYSFNSKINIIEEAVNDLKQDNWKTIKDLIAYANILSSLTEKQNQITLPDENKIRDYRRFFRNIHNEIRDGDKLDPAASFDELSKVLFLKAAEDEWMKSNKGQQVLTIEKIEEFEKVEKGMDYVNDWFSKAVREFYPEVFEDRTRIDLSLPTLKNVLRLMQSFHVRNGDVDIKGRAFEEFLPSQLRGKGLGQYFTPRPVVNFMADLADISIHDSVVDFACGSGGFLIKAFEQMQQLADELPDGTWKRLGLNKNDFIEDIKQNQIYGIDAEPRAARTAKMNMLMWGDGRRIVRGNALDIQDFSGNPYQPAEYNPHTDTGGCTLILANPPFGSKEKNQEILKRYDLGSKKRERDSQRSEILFLEKGLKLLKPQGRMLIVLPQGILSNESYEYVRDYIHSQAEIRAIVSLPTHAFVQSGVQTVKTCILYVQKFTEEKKTLFDEKTKNLTPKEIRKMLRTQADFDYSIFMGIAEFIGYEPNGRPNVKKGEKTDLHLLLEDYRHQEIIEKPKVDLFDFSRRYYDEKPSKRREQTVRGSEKGLKTSFKIRLGESEERLDPPYYIFKYQSQDLLLSFTALNGSITESGNRFRPTTDEEMDKEYPILSVTNDGKVSLNEYWKGEDFTQSYKQVREGDITYNPYRVNIGSIGVVEKEFDGAYVSPAYVVFSSKKYDPHFLVDLLRSPFYKMYIDITSTGSIRDSLSFDLLQSIKIPELETKEQILVHQNLQKLQSKITKLADEIDNEKQLIIDELHVLIRNYNRSNPNHLGDFNAVLKKAVKG